MKKKIKIKIPSIDILKETPEERKQRINQSSSSMITRIVPNKRKKTTKQQRQIDSNMLKQYNESW